MGTKLKEWLFPSNKKSEYTTTSVEIASAEINEEKERLAKASQVNQPPRIFKLNSYNDAPHVADEIINGKSAIVDLTDSDIDTAKRIIDFLQGVSYTINGNIEKVAKLIYLFTPTTK